MEATFCQVLEPGWLEQKPAPLLQRVLPLALLPDTDQRRSPLLKQSSKETKHSEHSWIPKPKKKAASTSSKSFVQRVSSATEVSLPINEGSSHPSACSLVVSQHRGSYNTELLTLVPIPGLLGPSTSVVMITVHPLPPLTAGQWTISVPTMPEAYIAMKNLLCLVVPSSLAL